MSLHDTTPPLAIGIIRIGLFNVPLNAPQIVDSTPITAITIDGRVTPTKVMTTTISMTKQQRLHPASIINTAIVITKEGQVHLQNLCKTNLANSNVASPEPTTNDTPALVTPTNKASKYA
jgi:hypothetical protein